MTVEKSIPFGNLSR